MDPIELLELCLRGARQNIPVDTYVPHLFSAGEYEDLWRRNPIKVRRLFDSILCAPCPGIGLELLMKTGCLEALLPEIREMRGLGDDPASALHKDVWEHTKAVVSGTPNQLELRWGALMHDIGKARTRVFDGRKVTFHNHDMVGARMVDRIEQRLQLFGEGELYTTVRMLVLNHLRPTGYKKSWTDSGVRRLLTDIGGPEGFERLMHLSRADLTTKNANKREQALARGRELEARIKEIFTQDNAPKLPKGTMGLIIERKACAVGPALNVLRANLEHMMKVGELPIDKDAEWYATEGMTLYHARHRVLTEMVYGEMQDVLKRGQRD